MLSDADMHTLYDRDWGPFAQPERDAATVELGKTLDQGIGSIADMSCGGAGVTPELGRYYGVVPILGDFGNVYGYQYVGTFQETVPCAGGRRPVRLHRDHRTSRRPRRRPEAHP